MSVADKALLKIASEYSDKDLCEYIVHCMIFRGHVMKEFVHEFKKRNIKFESINLIATFDNQDNVEIDLNKWIERKLK